MSSPSGGPSREDLEKQDALFRFIDLMVRQTCRRAYYEKELLIKASKDDEESIYSNDYLTKIYGKPREYIYQLVKNPKKTLKGLRVDNVEFLERDEDGYTQIEEKMLLDFVKKVHEHAPKAHLVWIDLQHYLFYAYRRFASWSPKAATETLSSYFVCEMRELINCLRTEDESQLWLRVFTLLREYCIFAQWHYSHNDKEEALAKFIIYYEAMLTAAKSLLPVFVDFENILYKNYGVCWIDFNTFIFIRFFYESDRVKIKVDECIKTKKSPGDTPQTFALLNKIRKTWSTHHTQTSLINEAGKLPENSVEALKEKKLLSLHKELLSATFWVDRSEELKQNIDLSRMDHNLFDLLRDRHFYPEGPGLNKNGQCICEECLIAKYKIYLDSNDDFSCIATEERTTFCRKCKSIVDLDLFHRHLNRHTDDIPLQKEIPKQNLTHPSIDKIDFPIVSTSDPTSLCEMFSDKLKISGGESLHSIEHNKPKKQDPNLTKTTNHEKLVQSKKDSKSGEKVKNGRSPSLRDELIANGFGKALGDGSNQLASPHVTAEKLAEVELMLRELRKLGHKPSHTMLCKSGGSVSEEFEVATPHDEHLQPKKCDCTYCEVFGGTKVVQPRTRLKIRLCKRREHKKENDIDQKITPEENNRPKTDNRVPVPPSPDSSDFEAEKNNEVRGLVNYIVGSEAKTKAELAQKKAAKKARQREKKEQEKLQGELEIQRKLEEQIRQEEERQEILKMQREKLEEEKKLEETKLKKKLKKIRQAEKRQAIAQQKDPIEETMPAWVTIKRPPGGENGAPSVIITLQGCTPIQDKLLTSLVEKPADVEMQNMDIKAPSTTKTSTTESNGVKKKIKNMKPNPEPLEAHQLSISPKLISKGVTVTLAVDKNPVPIEPKPIIIDPFQGQRRKIKEKEEKREREPTEEEIRSLGNLRLPPGITLTKIEGPVSNLNYSESDSANRSSMMSKSGVIVVDTEKLIKKNEAEALKHPTKLSKNKKNKKKSGGQMKTETKDKPKMVTLKNPMFQKLQSQNLSKTALAPIEELAPAAIFTTENGMVTIRSSRLQQSLKNDLSKPPTSAPLGMPSNPNLLPEMSNFLNPNHLRPTVSSNNIEEPMELESKKTTIAPIDAQEILLGLPGIEITKIEKNAKPENMRPNNSCQNAEVSIIPSNGPEFNLDFDKDDDWLYDDNIFKPRDVLEDDMDDEELEIEEFKRFCQESSIPPKEKTVAHFNVADIILKNKLK
ncbi:unnamed protein product [Ceutorhynchus assimilis]|uniref:FAM193 C-terminal domain-containing protein n=1 Tax=Ceutorhynchus assimilis TaxID=467358 RepID=A0A9P0DJB1_9CUCU|nr:unnamed protein product [Ceutorhynchus assimilis]